MSQNIRIVFKSGKEVTISLRANESFESFWKETVKSNYLIAGDTMFNVSEVEYSTTI